MYAGSCMQGLEVQSRHLLGPMMRALQQRHG